MKDQVKANLRYRERKKAECEKYKQFWIQYHKYKGDD